MEATRWDDWNRLRMVSNEVGPPFGTDDESQCVVCGCLCASKFCRGCAKMLAKCELKMCESCGSDFVGLKSHKFCSLPCFLVDKRAAELKRAFAYLDKFRKLPIDTWLENAIQNQLKRYRLSMDEMEFMRRWELQVAATGGPTQRPAYQTLDLSQWRGFIGKREKRHA